MDNTDPRYVAAELDAGWASDAPVDVVDLLTRYRSRIEMMHVKDLTNVAPPGRSGQPVQLGTGEINYGPIFAAAKNSSVKWYHYELDPPSPSFDALGTARNSFDAVRGAAAPALYAGSPQFTAGQQLGQTAQPVAIKVENLGDAPLNITGVSLANQGGTGANAEPTSSTGDFQITSNTCTTGPIAAAVVGQEASSCTVYVRFNPRRAYTTSIAKLQFASNSDAATNSIPLVATSGQAAPPQVTVGGTVGSQLALDLTGPAGFGAFIPGTAKDYTTSLLAEITSTTPDATLSVADASSTAAGHLVNGTTALQQALKLRATNGTQTAPAFAALPESGAALPLLTYSAPTTKDRVTVGFSQSIGERETLLRGNYSKTLTFTLTTTQP
jgi:hypothetical protein